MPWGGGADPLGLGASAAHCTALPSALVAREAVEGAPAGSAAAGAGTVDLRGNPVGTLATDAWLRRGDEIARSFDAAFRQPEFGQPGLGQSGPVACAANACAGAPPAEARALESTAESQTRETAIGKRGAAPQGGAGPLDPARASCIDSTAGGEASEARAPPAEAFGPAGALQEPGLIGARATVLRCVRELGPVPEPQAGGRRRRGSDTDTEALVGDQAPRAGAPACPPNVEPPPTGR